MLDDQQDELLQGLAADYHRPPATPREEIWARIRAERAIGDQDNSILPFRPVAKAGRPSPVGRALIWVTGVAALLAVGIGIGRLMPVDGAPVPGTLASEDSGPLPDRVATVMDMAVRQYLSRTETLLVGVRTGDDTDDFTALARELLGMTRLLLDRESVTDPTTRGLLEDLELVLAQLVVLPVTGNRAQERTLITAGMADRNLMERLRTALPSPLGSAPAVYGEL